MRGPITPAVVGTFTVMDGFVVRWYETPEDHRVMLSASRDAVAAPAYTAAEPFIPTAVAVHKALKDWYAVGAPQGIPPEVAAILTHQRRGLFGPLEPINPEA